DNAAALRAELTAAGHRFATEVDTEVIAHLLEQQLDTAAPRTSQAVAAAIASVATRLEGSWALAVVVRGLPEITVSSHRSPLLLAAGADGDTVMAASDLLGLAPELHEVREIADGAIVTLGRRVRWYDHHGRSAPAPRPLPVVQRSRLVPLQGAEDFTGREITEQPAVAQQLIDTFAGRLAHGRLLDDLGVPVPTRIRLVACGSSAYAAQVIARMITILAKIPATVTTASEPGYEPDIPGTLTIAFSQSGETADILTALDLSQSRCLAVTNTPHSTLARRADAVLDLGCGPERGVAATKSFTAQVIAGSALALALAARTRTVAPRILADLEHTLAGIPSRLAATDALSGPAAAEIAPQLAEQPGWIFVSRGAGLPYAYEGALKLKELAYRWTEALPAGELKHGPIALLQSGTPAVVIEAEPRTRLATNAAEMATRDARILTVGPGPNAILPTFAPPTEPPWGPLEATVALQHLARHITRNLGHNVDRPRNLAKSVTVE
ncbi:MAG TPA: SIS domain-containing protein, partial [Pseudonocardiaceae bacterium]|nr:SIS domain-containing protein [Pseudonocardiaceae bacterium]